MKEENNRYWNAQELRATWIKFWQSKNHYYLPSASLVSQDPSLFWINSGVAGLKEYFLGLKPTPSKRLFNIQKSLRTNDIDQIGMTNRHLSFFEMLGHFSLNDYHKKTAIEYGWEFLTSTKYLGLDKNKIYLTIFKEDQEALDICIKELKIPLTNIVLGTRKTNFWDLGAGPCGPNLEFFYDLGVKFDPQNQGIKLLKKDINNDRYLEIWNIVFSDWINFGNKNYQPAPTKKIDTGAGFERLLTVLTKKDDCFETELFVPIIEKISKFIIAQNLSKKPHDFKMQTCIISDHIRAITFLLNDLYKSQLTWNINSRRGYVIRKLIRKATLSEFFLGIRQPMIFNLVPVVIEIMKDSYPELKKFQDNIINFVKKEEFLFLHTLLTNEKLHLLLNDKNLRLISGDDVFKLVTESGIPLEYLKIIAHDHNLNLDLLSFNKLWKIHQIKSQIKPTEFVKPWQILVVKDLMPTKFLEINNGVSKKIIGIFSDNQLKKEINSDGKDAFWIITNETPFFPEKGGQIYDIGTIEFQNVVGTISATYLNNERQIIHLVNFNGTLKIGDQVKLKIDQKRRNLIAKNHSGTHLLQAILRKLYGKNLKQNGSYLNDKFLRFDFFTTKKKFNFDDFDLIQLEVNNLIDQNLFCKIEWITKNNQKNHQALSFFNVDKFTTNRVRVVNFGTISSELCGGTHVKNTKEIEQLMIYKLLKIGENNFRIFALTDNLTIVKFWTDVDNEREKILNKYEDSFIKQILATEIGKNYQEKLAASRNNFLLNQNYWEQFKAWLFKQNNLRNENKISKLVKEYLIPQTDFIAFKDYQLLFHLINPVNKLQNPIKFLRNIFDNYKQKPNLVLCLIYQININDLMFIFQDNVTKTSWSLEFAKHFKDQIKFGGKNNKLQGILKIKDFKKVKTFLLDILNK